MRRTLPLLAALAACVDYDLQRPEPRDAATVDAEPTCVDVARPRGRVEESCAPPSDPFAYRIAGAVRGEELEPRAGDLRRAWVVSPHGVPLVVLHGELVPSSPWELPGEFAVELPGLTALLANHHLPDRFGGGAATWSDGECARSVVVAGAGLLTGCVGSARRLPDTGGLTVMYGLPAVAWSTSEQSTLVALSSKVWTADGAVVWDDPDAARRDIYPSPVLADLTGDGVVDLVSGLGLLDGRTWTRVCTLGDGDGHVAIADLDLDGEPEIIATVFPTPWDGGQELVVANADCSVRWRTPVISAVGPTLADFDGDGAPEIALRADHGGTPNTDSHAVYDGDGTLLWARDDPTPPGGSSLLNYAPAFDFDRDGAAELIGAISGHLAVFDGRTGEIRLEAPDVPACGNGGVFPIDADGDGHAEIVSVASGCAAQITVVEQVDDQWPWATPVWNQYGYAITNVNLDGTLPEDPVPSWELYNSFRAGPTPRLGPNGELPHLVAHLAEVCTACADGVLTVTVEVGNRSVAPAVAPIGWVLEGEIGGTWTPLHRETHERGLQGGDWLTRRIEVPSAGVTGLRLRVDDDVDRVTECDHADHVEVWEGPLCGT